MSFLDLWDSYVEVRDNWAGNRELLERFLDFIKLRNEMEKSYCNKLDKLCNHSVFSLGKNTLIPVLEKYKSFYSVKLINSKIFIVYAQNSLIHPIEELLSTQEIKIKERAENIKKLQQEKKKTSKACEIAKERYWKSCKETLNNPKNKQEYLAKEEQSYENYIKHIDILNTFQVLYVEEIGKNLAVFQITQEEQLKNLREALKNLNEAEGNYIKSCITELESIPIAISVFNPITELTKFIDDTRTGNTLTLNSFELSPYGCSFNIPTQKVSSDDKTLLKVSIKCWEGINLREDEYRDYLSIINKSEGRKTWIYYLNDRRIKSHFKIPVQGFNLISKLMQDFLNCAFEDTDEYSAKMAIVLSQTFYQEKGTDKVYLYITIIGHKLWKREDIWIKMIEDGIGKEMNNYAQFCMDESSEEHRERTLAILMSQLTSYLHIMKTFQLSSAFCTNLTKVLAEKYKLPELNSLDS